MAQDRRSFLKTALMMGIGTTLLGRTTQLLGAAKPVKITVLHTNDVHSRIEPFPMDGAKTQGLGGFARRATLIKNIRATTKNVLLLDSGDLIQGTPYFNFYNGEVEIKLMNELGYDACTIGNHDFDGGIQGLANMMEKAKFPFLCANYDFSNNAVKGKTSPYKVFTKQGVKIGVFGLGIKLEGLVADKMHEKTVFNDPVDAALKTVALLKEKEKCQLIICLSHLGNFPRSDNDMCDPYFAKNTRDIDLVIGAHTHTFMDKPDIYKNLDGKEVMVFQVGWAGINLGRVDFEFDPISGKKVAQSGTAMEIHSQIEELSQG